MSEIRHQWNGTVLTVISDAGASSADLVGPKGDRGPRGPQGPGGIIYNEDGEVVVDLSEYYSKSEVDDLVANVEVDLSDYATKSDVTEAIANEMIEGKYATEDFVESKNYVTGEYVEQEILEGKKNLATENYVSTEIAKAQLAQVAGDVDLSGFITQDEFESYSATLGGYIDEDTSDYVFFETGMNIDDSSFYYFTSKPTNIPMSLGATYHYRVITSQLNHEGTFQLQQGSPSYRYEALFFDSDNGDPFDLEINYNANTQVIHLISGNAGTLYEFAIWAGDKEPSGLVPINGRFIPVDGETIIINSEGKLQVVGGAGSLASSEEVYY